jgi:hypothetical protein
MRKGHNGTVDFRTPTIYMENETNPLQNFIDSARRVFKPRINYQALPTPMLILEMAKEWTTALEIVVRTIDRPEVEQGLILRIARFRAARAHETRCLALLDAPGVRWETLAQLLFHMFAAEHILAQLSRRLLVPLRVGTVLAAVSAPDGIGREYYEAFLRVLNIDRLKDYGDREDPRDIRQNGIVGAMERVRKLEAQLRAVFPRPRAFIITPEMAYWPECRRWDWSEFRREEMARVQAGLCVYFHPEIERLSASAWGEYHDRARERDALKRGGPGRKPPGTNEAADIDEAKSDGEQDLGRKWIVHYELDEEECATATDTTEQEAHSNLFVGQIIHVAKTNLGDEAETYFEGLAQDLTQKEAAARAGISARTGREYQTSMNLLLREEKPPDKA